MAGYKMNLDEALELLRHLTRPLPPSPHPEGWVNQAAKVVLAEYDRLERQHRGQAKAIRDLRSEVKRLDPMAHNLRTGAVYPFKWPDDYHLPG